MILAWESSDGVVELVVWLRGAYGTLGLGEAIKKTIDDFKKELEALHPDGLHPPHPLPER